MANDLRGFWKPPASVAAGMKADRKAAAFNINRKAGKRRKSSGSPAKPEEARRDASDGDAFYKSLKWRQLRYLVLKNVDGRCQCCGASAGDGVRIHVDHIKPRKTHPELSLCIDNVQVMCEECNIGKGSWDSTDWRVKMG